MRLFSNMLTFNRVRDGEDGKQGPMPVNAGQWSKDIEYIKDEFVQPYVWQIKNGKKLYYLLVAEKSKGDDPYTNNTQGNGDIWRYREEYDLFLARKIQADEIDTRSLTVSSLRTNKGGPRIEAVGSEMKVYGLSEHPNIIFGINEQGFAVLSYYDNNGKKLYDLGPDGISKLHFAPQSWTALKLTNLIGYKDENKVTWSDLSDVTEPFTEYVAPEYYRYYAGGDPTISDEEKLKEKFLYKSQFASSDNYIEDGWYYIPLKNNHLIPEIMANGTYQLFKPDTSNRALYSNPNGVFDIAPIYFMLCYLYKNGLQIASKIVYWNGTFDNNQAIPNH